MCVLGANAKFKPPTTSFLNLVTLRKCLTDMIDIEYQQLSCPEQYAWGVHYIQLIILSLIFFILYFGID